MWKCVAVCFGTGHDDTWHMPAVPASLGDEIVRSLEPKEFETN